MVGARYLLVAVAAIMFLLELLFGKSGPAVIELAVVVVTMPVAIVHLAILLFREWRQS